MVVNDLSQLLQQGASHAWLFFPTVVVLGALHGLEPGHSKTMMAAFIVAIRGTIAQAVLLGVSAAVSHSLVIWTLAAFALGFGSHWSAETAEPYFQLVSAVIVASLAVWMFWQTPRDVTSANAHSHDHTHATDGD
jgi:nickel/cobalt exporter